MSQKTAVIIGAGYGGMALANLLGKAGYKVAVAEKNAAPGGRIAAVKKDGFVFDIGPSWYLMPEIFGQYYSLFGLSAAEQLDLIRFNPGYKVFFENQPPLMIQGDGAKDRAVFETIEPGAGARFDKYLKKSTLTYELATKYFLYNNFRRPIDFLKPAIIKHAFSMLSLTMRPLDNYVSRYFKDQRLKQLLEYHMVFLGSSPFQAPAIYNLMSHLDFRSGVYYPSKGMLSLADNLRSLGEQFDIEYKFNSPVKRILVKDGKATGVECESGEQLQADIVVSNADLHHTETLLLGPADRSFNESYWSKRQPGPGALLISLGVKGELPDLLHHNLYFVDKWRKNFDAIYSNKAIPEHASLYVCNPTKTDPSLAPKGHENLFILMPIPAGVNLSNEDEEKLADKTISTLSRIIEVPDLAQRIVSRHIFGPDDFNSSYNSWQSNAFGGESHLLSQSVIFRTNNQSRRVKNLFYVGAGTLPGIGLPMCLIGAQLTFKKIMNDNRPGPLTPEDL